MPRRASRRRIVGLSLLASLALALGSLVGGGPSLRPEPARAADQGRCPTGYTQTGTLLSTDFESALSAAWVTHGFSVVDRPSAASGTHVLSSSMVGLTFQHDFGTPVVSGTLQDRTFVVFSVRWQTTGDPSQGGLRFGGSVAGEPRPFRLQTVDGLAVRSVPWRTVAVDVTDQVRASGRFVFYQYDWTFNSGRSVDIDDLSIVACNRPASRVRGDTDGDGRLNILDADTGLRVRDTATGQSLIDITSSSVLTLAYPGDVNGDGRTDVLIRTPEGDIKLLAGTGSGMLAPPVTIGTYFGYGYFADLVPLGDVNGDGDVDLYARSRDGLLRRYSISRSGRMYGGTVVGSGWSDYSWPWTTSIGDVNGDGRQDLLGINRAGELVAYMTAANGGFTGETRRIGTGWTGLRPVNQGDVDGDGHDDLLVRKGSQVYVYRGDGHGGWLGISGPLPGDIGNF